MKAKWLRYFFIVTIFLHCLRSSAQFEVFTLNVKANDLVYDKITDRIYATLAPSNGTVGNTIGIINPITYSLENTVFIGSDPSVMAISDNGKKIFVGFNGSSTVRKFDVPSLTSENQFSIGSDPFFGPFYVEDIEVIPGSSLSIAVSRKILSATPQHQGVAIYDDGVIRTLTTQVHTGSNRIEFLGPNNIIGINNETSEFGLRTLTVTPAGVSQTGVLGNMVPGYYSDFILHKGISYFSTGRVIDCSMSPFIAGQLSGAYGPAAFDTIQNRVCYASNSSFGFGNSVTFKRYNPTTYNIVDSIFIPQATTSAKKLISCGTDRYAFCTDNNLIFIHAVINIGIDENFISSKPVIYPNPVVDHLTINNGEFEGTAELKDIAGRKIEVISLTKGETKVNLTKIEKGVYSLQIKTSNGNYSSKVIKE